MRIEKSMWILKVYECRKACEFKEAYEFKEGYECKIVYEYALKVYRYFLIVQECVLRACKGFLGAYWCMVIVCKRVLKVHISLHFASIRAVPTLKACECNLKIYEHILRPCECIWNV